MSQDNKMTSRRHTTAELAGVSRVNRAVVERVIAAPYADDPARQEDAPQYNGSGGRHKPYTLRELYDRPELLEPPAMILPHGLALPGRVTLLSAREKAGKSTLAGQAVSALSKGDEFLGMQLAAARVLWYGIDEPLSDCVRRFQLYGADADAIRVQNERPTVAQMRDEITDTKPAVVVVDVMQELWRGHVESDRDAQQVGAFIRPYIGVARKTNTALILLHHTTKAGAEYRGSVELGAAVDVVLTLRRASVAQDGNREDSADDDGRRTLSGTGRGVRANARLTFDGLRYSAGDAPMPLRSRILSELRRDPVSANALAEMLRARKQNVTDEIRSLLNEGLIERRGTGPSQRYQLTSLDRAGDHPI
jgi:hypothetical protein